MKHVMIYDNFNLKKFITGVILKRKTFDDKTYNLFLITKVKHDYSNLDIFIYQIGYTNIYFDNIHFIYNKEGNFLMNKWFTNEYEYLTDDEYKIILNYISNCQEYILEKIKKDTNIDISTYPLKYDINKYNL